jgi:pantetheine-phosphate adenylyltransferase
MSRAIFAGTFDPVTMGHLDLVERARELFDELIVAVAVGHHKQTLFSVDERLAMFVEATSHLDRVSVVTFDGLLVNLAREHGTHVVVRGLRMVSDFEYEYQMALMNRKLDRSFETVFLMPSARYTFLNSTVIKEIGRLGGSLEGLVPDGVRARFAALRAETPSDTDR